MKIIIIGAGELGRLVSEKLSALNYDVVMVDTHAYELENKLDAMLLEGEGTSVGILKQAGAETADLLFALSGNESANVMSCAIASRLGTKQTICRLFSMGMFSKTDGITPELFSIGKVFSSIGESVEQISSILQNQILLDQISFSNPDAVIDVIRIPLNSVFYGRVLKTFAGNEVLDGIRLAAIIRNRELVVPRGDTILQPGDRIYVSGRKEKVAAFLEWLSREASAPIRRVVIAGLSPVAEHLLPTLLERHMDVRIIEKDHARVEKLLGDAFDDIMLLEGDPTEAPLLTEADVAGCDAFAALSVNDENNILACLLASRLGAKKVIALTAKAEYMDILPSIERAGCWFNMTQIAANAAFRLMSSGTIRVDAELNALNARLFEAQLGSRSSLVGKQLMECKMPDNFTIALILRQDQVITPVGSTRLHAGDTIVGIANDQTIIKLKNIMKA